MHTRLLLFLYSIFCLEAGFAQTGSGSKVTPTAPPMYYDKPTSTTKESNSMVYADSYTELKYSLSFANQVQMAYCGMKLKQYINESLLETGDLAYYTGHYFNASARYFYALDYLLPETERRNQLGLYAVAMNAFDSSKLSDRSLQIYTSAATTVGLLYQTRGKFINAEVLLTRALNWRAYRFGKTSKEYINSLHNMAVLKKDLGQYEESERMFNYLVPAFKKLFTENSMQYVVVLNNKAMLLAELGRTKEAIQLLDESLRLGKDVLDPAFIDYERILTNRALVEQETGNLDAAEVFYKQVNGQMEKKGFDDHPDNNNVLVYYGSLLVKKNDPGVKSFLENVTAKVRKRYGDKHPLLARALSNSGDYYMNKGAYNDAADIFEDALQIQKNALGDKNKDYLNTLVKSAVCNWRMSKMAAAKIKFSQAISNYLFLVNTYFPSMSESEKANFYSSLKPNIECYFAFAAETGESDPALLTEMYTVQLKTKGILINATRKVKSSIIGSGDSAMNALYAKWLNLKSTILAYYSSPLEDQQEDKIDLGQMEQQANAMEKALSKKSSLFNEFYQQQEFSFTTVRDNLVQGEAAMELIRVFDRYTTRPDKISYIGLIVKKGSPHPSIVRLPNGKDLEEKGIRLYRSNIKFSKDNAKNDSTSYQMFWQPFEKMLTGITGIYLSVDGVYNNVNINTLQRGDGKYLLDCYTFFMVSSTRSLVTGLAKEIPITAKDNRPVLMGSPQFGNDAVVPPLPGTKTEIEQINSMLNGKQVRPVMFTGENATTENLETAVHPVFLHIATHGFFNPMVNAAEGMSMGIMVSKARGNPLLRSGLLLTGAAATINNEPVLGGKPANGILYAYHAMNLDLKDTRLVVMSACETGIGEVVNGEGVYGLSRAFQVAGARKIIMSLWKVDDQATQELMTAFYENWLSSGNPQEAFLQAQRKLKEKYPKPFYWGAFVLMN